MSSIVAAGVNSAVPLLESGDRMNRAEFHRRYLLLPELKKAELIEGVVFMPSPVSVGSHAMQASAINGWLFVYRAQTPGIFSADAGTVLLDDWNEPQPDAMMWIPRALGGQSELGADGYLHGAPELAVEIANSSRSRDMGPKRDAYLRNSVREYLVWLVEEGRFALHRLHGDEYIEEPLDEKGVWRSEVFPGLWLDTPAMLAGDFGRVLDLLQTGLGQAEHAAFVRALAGESPP